MSISGVNPCLNFTCWDGSHCAIDRLGIAECRCKEPTLCETSVRPVCGTNGYTYESKCHLEQISCSKRSDIKVAYDGHCGKNYAALILFYDEISICFINESYLCWPNFPRSKFWETLTRKQQFYKAVQHCSEYTTRKRH